METELQVALDGIEGEVQRALEDLFGTPDSPHWPAILVSDSRFKSWIDPLSLDRAAGPVGRDKELTERGLYRKHCATCHGIAGDGLGPTAALLNPYPRDFRRGSFKFKSTGQGVKPTLDDLVRTLQYGIPGTSMPAMANLMRGAGYDSDIPVLASYVRFLSIRGEVERRLMMEIVPAIELEKKASLYDVELKHTEPDRWAKQQASLEQLVVRVALTWLEAAPSEAKVITEKTWDAKALKEEDRESFLRSAVRGRQVFQSEVAACALCHGKDGDGRGKIADFDEWTKDWTIRAGIDPKKKEEWKPLRRLGLLKPTVDPARNLQLGVFRGGDSPESIYRAIVNGIEGTPMPAAACQPSVKNGLNEEQLADLVNYCQALGIENLRREMEAFDGNR